MLDIFKFRCRHYCIIAQIICVVFSTCFLAPVYGSFHFLQETSAKDYEWIEQYVARMNKSSSPREWIGFLHKLKSFLDKKGYKPSSLIDMAQIYRSELESHGVVIDEANFNYLINLICGESSNFIISKNHHSKKHQ